MICRGLLLLGCDGRDCRFGWRASQLFPESQASVRVANPAPNAATMDSLANSAPTKLAAETLATAAVCVIVTVRPRDAERPAASLRARFRRDVESHAAAGASRSHPP